VCQENGIEAWDCVTKEEVLVIPSVMAMVGDNPMQSEFACHIGFRGKKFCRVCGVINEAADDGEEDVAGGDDTRSVRSEASENSAVSGTAAKSKKGKASESLEGMIGRVKAFMQVRTRCRLYSVCL
jgi:hypothetical protein